MKHSKTEYADVILPFSVPILFTYKIPQTLKNKVVRGSRVLVPFSKTKLFTALVYSLHDNKPENYEIKSIDTCLDSIPIVTSEQFKLWDWISEYYMCSLGEVMKAALPSGFKLESETVVYYDNTFLGTKTLSNAEELVFNILAHKETCSIKELQHITKNSRIQPVIASLLSKQAIFIREKVFDSYKQQTESHVYLQIDISDKETVANHLKKLISSPKQKKVLEFIISEYEKQKSNELFFLKQKDIMQTTNASSKIIHELEKKEYIKIIQKNISRVHAETQETQAIKSLDANQTAAYKEIKQKLIHSNICLLHGVTASGKTEVYITYMQHILSQGKQVLYIVPEIALTTQIITRLQKVFGNKVGIYHSRLNDNERIEIWNTLRANDDTTFQIILGVRSSIFLPFSNLGAIIIDEEHETSFKQQDPAPRYNARDTAIVLASFFNAKIILGSATPSLETYFNVLTKKYEMVELFTRYGNFEMPEISIIDLAKAYKRKQMYRHFSKELLTHIYHNLEQNKQIILFQNRRGYSPFIECENCGDVPRCKNCEVSLTYHKSKYELSCHYCGYTISLKKTCNVCKSSNIVAKGFGTEKIEEELQAFFPNHTIARMDLDTTRGKHGFSKLIYAFEQKEIDILIGTQMVTKGLDFENVGLVGILNADNLLNMPDFRAFERGFQLMVQVAGRAGRSEAPGKVYIQTFSPNHPIFQHVLTHNYQSFFNEHILERQTFRYPPFVRLIRILIKHKSKEICSEAADMLVTLINPEKIEQILGPEFPPIERVQNVYAKHILLKISKRISYKETRITIETAIASVVAQKDFSRVVIQCDVDPY